MQWLNEPSSWQRTGDEITVNVDPGTDFWRETGYGYIRDSGHVYGEVLSGDLDVSARVRGTFAAQYDQAGIMLRVDDRVWLKTGMEFFEGRARLSTVLTLGRSSWMVTDLPEGTDEISIRASRRGDAVEVRYLVGEGPAELAALVFLPPGREVLAGVMCAAPEGPGFGVKFSELRIDDREWREGDGDALAWDGQPAADDDDALAWDGQPAADGDASWTFTPAGNAGSDWAQTRASAADLDAEPEWPAGQADASEPGSAAADGTGTAGTSGVQPSDPVADWERLAAVAKARLWESDPAADLADQWPGPPLTGPAAAGGGPRVNGRAGRDQPAGQESSTVPAPAGKPGGAGHDPAAAVTAAHDMAADDTRDGIAATLADDRTEPELPAASVPPPASGQAGDSMPKRPPIDLAPPADPADEWISLLTADD